MNQSSSNTKKFSKYFENQKKVWYDSKVSVFVKVIIRLVELHRSDSKGWYLSERKIASLLGISTNTASKAIDIAIDSGYLEASTSTPRKRRKLRLSASLRAPVEFPKPPSSKLSQWEMQAASANATDSASSSESVNNKEISNANINDSYESQFEKEKESQKSPSYKKSEAYRKLLQRRKELGI